MTVGCLLPATTCALVTISPSPITAPLPSWMREHAGASTFTVDRAIWSAWSLVSPLSAGGGPSSGAGPKPSKTRGPSTRRSACVVSGASGK